MALRLNLQGFLHLFLYLQFKKELFHLRRPIILLLGLYLAAAAFLYIISPKKAESQSVLNSPPDFTRPSALETGSYLIYDESSGDILDVPREDFIAATVALEMDPYSPKEALKAQAGIEADKRKIQLDAPIKAFGTYKIEIKLFTVYSVRCHCVKCVRYSDNPRIERNFFSL